MILRQKQINSLILFSCLTVLSAVLFWLTNRTWLITVTELLLVTTTSIFFKIVKETAAVKSGYIFLSWLFWLGSFLFLIIHSIVRIV